MCHECLTLYSRDLPTTKIVICCLNMKNPPLAPQFVLWVNKGQYYGEFHIFWSKLRRSYNNYCQSSFAYLECQKLNNSTNTQIRLSLSDLNNNEIKQDVNIINLITNLIIIIIIIIITTTLYYNCSSYLGKMFA